MKVRKYLLENWRIFGCSWVFANIRIFTNIRIFMNIRLFTNIQIFTNIRISKIFTKIRIRWRPDERIFSIQYSNIQYSNESSSHCPPHPETCRLSNKLDSQYMLFSRHFYFNTIVHKPRPCLVDAESYKNATHSVPSPLAQWICTIRHNIGFPRFMKKISLQSGQIKCTTTILYPTAPTLCWGSQLQCVEVPQYIRDCFSSHFSSYVQPKTIFLYCKSIVFGWIYELICEEKISIVLGLPWGSVGPLYLTAPTSGGSVGMLYLHCPRAVQVQCTRVPTQSGGSWVQYGCSAFCLPQLFRWQMPDFPCWLLEDFPSRILKDFPPWYWEDFSLWIWEIAVRCTSFP